MIDFKTINLDIKCEIDICAKGIIKGIKYFPVFLTFAEDK